MPRDFFSGMGSINLFPTNEKTEIPPLFLSDDEAFKKDMESVSQDMWGSIKIINHDYPECK